MEQSHLNPHDNKSAHKYMSGRRWVPQRQKVGDDTTNELETPKATLTVRLDREEGKEGGVDCKFTRSALW